jgi:hypothetical protein
MVRIRIPSVFANRGDPSLTLDMPRGSPPRDALIVQQKSARHGHAGGAHLSLRLPIAYLLSRMQKLRACAPKSRENRPKSGNLGQDDGSDHNASEHRGDVTYDG